MDINNFGPFQSNVWGTVSEWIMIFVTTLTARYLYSTLKSQLRILQIEESRYKLSIMPIFDINVLPESTYIVENGEYKLNILFEIKLISNNSARVVFIYLPNDNEWTYSVQNVNIIKNFKTGDIFQFKGSKNGSTYLIDEIQTEFVTLNFNIEFADDINNQYLQKVKYYRLKGFESISISQPENNGRSSEVITNIVNRPE